MTYIETYGGNRVDILLPDPAQITVEDIAHALAHVPRFAGHTKRFYSVAAHSINVARLVPDEHKLQALLHDATEAYLGDMPTPFKRVFGEYRAAEERLWKAIAQKFNVPVELHKSVKQADGVMLMTERDELKPHNGWWGDYEDNLRVPLDGLIGFSVDTTSAQVKAAFMAAFTNYDNKRALTA